MTAAAVRSARVGGSIVARLGDLVTYQAQTGATFAAAVVIGQASDALWVGGEVRMSEHHEIGHMLVSAFPDDAPPVLGDRLTLASGTRYEVDQAPTLAHGLWSLVLRRLA